MRILLSTMVGLSCIALAACDVDKTQEGDLPEVDVNVSGGELPEFDVDGPEVNVGTQNVVVQVPDVDVDLPEDGNQQ